MAKRFAVLLLVGVSSCAPAIGRDPAPDASQATELAMDVVSDSAHDAPSQDAGPAVADACVRPNEVLDPDEDEDITYPDGPDGHAPGVCFVGLPPADAFVADVPPPDWCACPKVPPGFFEGAPIPKPTLQLEIGKYDKATGTFAPLTDGAWVPLIHGSQGGVHLALNYRVLLPGVTEPTAKQKLTALAYLGCTPVAVGNSPVSYAVEADSPAFSYVGPTNTAGGELWVIFTSVQGAKSWLICGLWTRLHVQLRDSKSGAWGETEIRVRIYDTPIGGAGN